MRYYPAAIALSLLAAVSVSMGQGATPDVNPRVEKLLIEGRASLAAGKAQEAIDAFEAALAVQPGNTAIYLDLAQAASKEGMQGKAIHFYREALERDPNSFAALSGEGKALVDKGATEKAKRNLAKLQSLCGDSCEESKTLAAKIEHGPTPRVLTAEAVTPKAEVTQN